MRESMALDQGERALGVEALLQHQELAVQGGLHA
jgi:hypothetical protein